MQRLFNDGWRFAKLPLGSGIEDARAADWTRVDLPHDFLIHQADDLYESCDGWYRRALQVPEEWLGKRVLLRFDGVYMDCDVLLNGGIVCAHHYGYTAFDADLTGFLRSGENELMVHIRHASPNSRWYSGAGIFRDVTLHVLEPRHIPLDGTYVTTARSGKDWTLTVAAELAGPEGSETLSHRLLDGKGNVVAACEVPAAGSSVEAAMTVEAPDLWHPDEPNLYTLETRLGGQVIRQNVGFREYSFSPDTGLSVNGRPVKLRGVCLHHDLGALGAAFHVKAARRQLKAMKTMGVNALRTSHNPPARQMLDLCDELGILVVDELLDMWVRPKTDFDYARFFPTDMPADVASWVRRDRNHPCLLMWSLGNEILDTHLDASAVGVAKALHDNVRLHDPKRNGLTTIGSNYMPWEGAQNCAAQVDAAGYNYGEKYYEEHHAAHPDWLIYGSETASALSSRGIYRFPMDVNILSDEDMQCSDLANSINSWGTPDMRRCIVEDLNTPYSMGQFLWTGTDYIGEPTPYRTRSSYFGMMDTACFPKEYWWLIKSLWTDEPMAHIGVTWDWNPGQTIDIPVMTNAASAELFLNGRSLGRQEVERRDWQRCRPVWRAAFEPGELCARAYDGQGNLIAEDIRRTSGDSASIVLSAEDSALLANGEDMTFVTITMADDNGLPVDNAIDRVHVAVTGPGRLLGLDNGDSTDREGYKTTTRRLFSGKLLAMIGTTKEAGVIRVTVSSPGKAPAVLEIPAVEAPGREGIACDYTCPDTPMPQDVPVRRIDLVPLSDGNLTPDRREVIYRVRVLPENAAPQSIEYRVTSAKGIPSPCAEVIPSEGTVTVRALGDGDVYLRATCTNGYGHARVISQQEISIRGVGQAALNPYEFILGGLYDLSDGDIGEGNEQGLTFGEGTTMAGFSRVDFGDVGSDEITLPIFALNDEPYFITIWQGDPRHGGESLGTFRYQKPSIWATYQPETYKLPRRLAGIKTICFTMAQRVHLHGFSFTRQSRAWLPLSVLEADTVYGDSFARTEKGIVGIGNNVSIEFAHMDFGEATSALLTIDGATALTEQPVTIRFRNAEGKELTALAPFAGGERGEQTFRVDVLPGECTVSFVFLPGSRFDFYGFRFRKES